VVGEEGASFELDVVLLEKGVVFEDSGHLWLGLERVELLLDIIYELQKYPTSQ
jgi:hypothetical protein